MYPEFFATKNKNKLQETNKILGLSLKQLEIDLVEPQATEVEVVVKEKAKTAFLKTNQPVLVEDTSLGFLAWRGLPGALIKWFLKTVGNEGIIKMLENETDRRAVVKSAFGFCAGDEVKIYIGEIKGEIAREERGENGFGFDQIFIPKNYKKTFAEMTKEEKNQISMRKIALQKLKVDFDRL